MGAGNKTRLPESCQFRRVRSGLCGQNVSRKVAGMADRISPAITDFQQSCQRYFICYSFANTGLDLRSKMLLSPKSQLNNSLIVGSGKPEEGRWHAAIPIGEAIESSKMDGIYSDKIAKSFMTAMFSEWEEVCRPRIASEEGITVDKVTCNLMGDLRLLRNCIVHNKSIITDEHTRLKELKWRLERGKLRIDADMFADLVDQINQMTVHTAD